MLSAVIGHNLSPMAFIFTSFFSRGGGAAFSFCSQIPIPVSVSFPALRLNFSFHCSPHAFYSSPSLCFSSTFSSVCHKTNKLPNLPSSHYWAFQSTPTAVVSEHLIHIRLESLSFSPPHFSNCAEKIDMFFPAVPPPPSMPLDVLEKQSARDVDYRKL